MEGLLQRRGRRGSSDGQRGRRCRPQWRGEVGPPDVAAVPAATAAVDAAAQVMCARRRRGRRL